MIKGYICRSRINKDISDSVTICVGSELPSQTEDGWFWYVPGWFHTMSIQKFKKIFGFSVKPGEYKLVNISVSEK